MEDEAELTGATPRRRPKSAILEIGGRRVPISAGETIIGSAPGSAIVLEGEGGNGKTVYFAAMTAMLGFFFSGCASPGRSSRLAIAF